MTELSQWQKELIVNLRNLEKTLAAMPDETLVDIFDHSKVTKKIAKQYAQLERTILSGDYDNGAS